MPRSNTPVGAYPFVLRVFDSQDRPQQQQFSINVVGKDEEIKETEESPIPEVEEPLETELECFDEECQQT